MGKVLKKEDIEVKILEEKITLYEIENSELQYMVKEYWKDSGLKRPEFDNIRDEIYYLINHNSQSNKIRLKKIINRLRGRK